MKNARLYPCIDRQQAVRREAQRGAPRCRSRRIAADSRRRQGLDALDRRRSSRLAAEKQSPSYRGEARPPGRDVHFISGLMAHAVPVVELARSRPFVLHLCGAREKKAYYLSAQRLRSGRKARGVSSAA